MKGRGRTLAASLSDRGAQAAYKQLKPKVREGLFDNLVKALCQCFKLDSQCRSPAAVSS